MRSLSASISPWLAIILLFCLVSCASNPPLLTPSEVQAELVGTITVSGDHPYERQLILADTSGVYWLVESPEYEGELLELGGQSIRALGIARTEASGYRSLLLRWYDLHPMPGRISGVGILERWGDDLVLVSPPRGRPEEGRRVLIVEGPLHSVLDVHIGYRVWISGESVHVPGEAEENASNLAVEPDEIDSGGPSAHISLIRVVALEYGVLGPPIPSWEASPRSTLPDSSR
jgi:hypothetical protein